MRKTTHLKLGGIAAAVVTMSIGVGATANASPSTKTISFEVAEYSTKTVPFWTNVVKQFNAANPTIHVDLTSIGWNQAQTTTVHQIAANDLPDIVNTATIWLPEWVNSGALQPVTSGMLSSGTSSNILPALYKVSSLYKGQTWGLPIAAATRALFYNKTLFSKAGLNPNAPPKTWAQLYTDAVAIKQKTGAYGYAFEASDVTAFRYFGFFLLNAGGQLLTSSGKAAFDSPAGVKALTFLTKIWNAKLTPNPIANDVANIEPVFEAGKVGMFIDSSYFTADIPSHSQLSYGVEPVPVSASGVTPVNWGVSDVLVISKNAPVADLKPFLNYIYQPKIQAQFDENEGFVPLEKTEATLPEFNNPTMKQFVQMLDVSEFDPFSPNFSQMQTILKTAMQEALLGKESPSAALATAAQQFNALPG